MLKIRELQLAYQVCRVNKPKLSPADNVREIANLPAGAPCFNQPLHECFELARFTFEVNHLAS